MQVLGPNFVTTFWRLIEPKSTERVFGFSIDSNGDLQTEDKDFDEKLKVIIFDVLQKRGFNDKLFSRLDTEEIESYLRQISEDDYKRVADWIEKQVSTNLFGEKSTSVPINSDVNRSIPKSSFRNYLIPKTCVLQIRERKINSIYHELKNGLLIDGSKNTVPNAVGVLFRVFLEISLDHYAERNGFGFNKTDTISQKIPMVVESLKERGHDEKKFNNINAVGSSTKQNSFLSIENFHEYVHSTTVQPSPGELKIRWDNLQEFFEILWGDLNKKTNAKKQNAKKQEIK